MPTTEWAKFSHNIQLDMGLLHAFYIQHAYPRHSHDYYVISVIGRGFQTFMHGGTKHFTQPGGLILINPQSVHTGEPADEGGFELWSLYPTAAHMQRIAGELTGNPSTLPNFPDVRVDDPQVTHSLLRLHHSLTNDVSPLEAETRFIQTLALLVRRYADVRSTDRRIGREREAVRKARSYIDTNFAERFTLQDLADHVALSPYHLLRVFHAEVGMPPHTYLESVRIRHAQQQIAAGSPLAAVAVEVGFSSQSHLTHHFKRIIGVTPGEYAREIQQHR